MAPILGGLVRGVCTDKVLNLVDHALQIIPLERGPVVTFYKVDPALIEGVTERGACRVGLAELQRVCETGSDEPQLREDLRPCCAGPVDHELVDGDNRPGPDRLRMIAEAGS